MARNSIFDCHLSPFGRQMAMENSVSNYHFYLQSSIVLMFPIAVLPVLFVLDFVNQNICCPITNSCLALSKGGKYLAWLKNLMLGVRQARHLS